MGACSKASIIKGGSMLEDMRIWSRIVVLLPLYIFAMTMTALLFPLSFTVLTLFLLNCIVAHKKYRYFTEWSPRFAATGCEKCHSEDASGFILNAPVWVLNHFLPMRVK